MNKMIKLLSAECTRLRQKVSNLEKELAGRSAARPAGGEKQRPPVNSGKIVRSVDRTRSEVSQILSKWDKFSKGMADSLVGYARVVNGQLDEMVAACSLAADGEPLGRDESALVSKVGKGSYKIELPKGGRRRPRNDQSRRHR